LNSTISGTFCVSCEVASECIVRTPIQRELEDYVIRGRKGIGRIDSEGECGDGVKGEGSETRGSGFDDSDCCGILVVGDVDQVVGVVVNFFGLRGQGVDLIDSEISNRDVEGRVVGVQDLGNMDFKDRGSRYKIEAPNINLDRVVKKTDDQGAGDIGFGGQNGKTN
jgi:hypothetical protein